MPARLLTESSVREFFTDNPGEHTKTKLEQEFGVDKPGKRARLASILDKLIAAKVITGQQQPSEAVKVFGETLAGLMQAPPTQNVYQLVQNDHSERGNTARVSTDDGASQNC